MTFIISNIQLKNSIKIKDLYIKGEFVRIGSHVLIFKGFLYPKNQQDEYELLEQFIKNNEKFLYDLKGYFCGIYYNLEKNMVFCFTDKFGYFDIFYYYSENLIIISDEFNEILLSKYFSLNNIDKDSLIEFILFEYPLFEKTFIKNIKFLSMGTINKVDLDKISIENIQYYDYKFNIDSNFNIKKNINKLDKLLNNATRRIKKLNTPDTIYGLGLSGGMDSRLVAYYAIKNKLKIKTFIFGEKNSDAYYISKKVAKALRLEHYELGFKKDFFKYIEKSVNYNPMMNVLYTWYYATYQKLPQFDILLTGYNGDNQFGSHLSKFDLKIKKDEDFPKIIFKKYCEPRIKKILPFLNNKSEILKIKINLINFAKKSKNSKIWQKKEEFNYKYRQRIYIKNNPSFNFLGFFKTYSIFIDPDLIEFLMTVPVRFRLNRRLFFKFVKKKIPILLKVRPEREIPYYLDKFLIKYIFKAIFLIDTKLSTNLIFKKSHKSVENWLSYNIIFIDYLNKIFSINNNLFYELINRDKLMTLISKGKWTFTEILLLFKFLTLKLFLDKIE